MAEPELVRIFRESTPQNSRYPITDRLHFQAFKQTVRRVFEENDDEFFTTKVQYAEIVKKAREMASKEEWIEGMTWTSGALCDFVREVKRRTRKGVELIQEGLHLILGNKNTEGGREKLVVTLELLDSVTGFETGMQVYTVDETSLNE